MALIIVGFIIFGAVGYMVGDEYIGMGWLGALIGIALVCAVAFLDFLDNN